MPLSRALITLVIASITALLAVFLFPGNSSVQLHDGSNAPAVAVVEDKDTNHTPSQSVKAKNTEVFWIHNNSASEDPKPMNSEDPLLNKAYYKMDEPLVEEEEKIFLEEVKTVFMEKLPNAIDTSTVLPQVIRLNERYRRGLRSIVNLLSAPPQNDKGLKTRLASIDYLKYRDPMGRASPHRH